MDLNSFIESVKSQGYEWRQVDGCILNENDDTPGQALLRLEGVELYNEYCGNLKMSESAALHRLGLDECETIGLAVIGGFGGIRRREVEIRSKLLEALGLEETLEFHFLD